MKPTYDVVLKIIKLLENPFADYGLTDKQAEVCRMLAFGMSITEVAEKLGISKQAVYERVNGGLKKLCLESNGDLTKRFIETLKVIVS